MGYISLLVSLKIEILLPSAALAPLQFFESSDIIEIEGKTTKTLQFRTKEKLNLLDWSLKVINAENTPNKHPLITKKIVI
ncbi:MAG: hypothetical protein K9G31_09620 [Crocinitomicaceae bacterium]|nr:hypothetical protein [Crocinitomicaceae bacterium]